MSRSDLATPAAARPRSAGAPAMTAQQDAPLVVENACLRYGELDVLSGLSLSVGGAEIVSIVGPSGCGKTTLLRCVGGLNQLNCRRDPHRRATGREAAAERVDGFPAFRTVPLAQPLEQYRLWAEAQAHA